LCAILAPAACSTYGEDLLQSTQGAGETAGSDAKGGDAAKGGASAVGGVGAGTSGGTTAGGRAGAPAGGEAGAAGAVEVAGGGGSTSTTGGSGGKSGAGGTSTGGAANGGSGGGTAGGGTAGTPGIEMIDDFEADDPSMQIILKNKRNGYWYAFNDATAAGVQTFGIKPSTDRAGSTYALHMTASGFTSYGAGFGADFVNVAKQKVAYDVSAYKGIRFYAKVAASTQTSMKMLIPTTYSDAMGGKCSGTVDGTRCDDHLYCPFTGLKTAWALYECDFADLVQQGFGLPQPMLDPKSVYSVQFTFLTKTLPADVWVDDVAFVLK
jgi:hypothetical protein